MSFSFYYCDSNHMTLLNFNIYHQHYTILTADCSRITEVCLEAAGLVSDPLNSVVNKIAT